MSNELYAEAYAKNYNMTICGFRYFNVFGPKQDPDGPYAAVIPLFIKAALNNLSPTINGDGNITRDFTPVANVFQMNINGLFLSLEKGVHEVFNVACGATTTLNEIWEIIAQITGCSNSPNHVKKREGDILFSLANIKKAESKFQYIPVKLSLEELERTIFCYQLNK